MEITTEQHIQNWKGLYDNAIIALNDCKRESSRTNEELLNKNRELSMELSKIKSDLEKYKHFFRQVEVAQQTLVSGLYKKANA